MAELQVNIVKGGLGRQSANTDTWAGLFVEVIALPVGWLDYEVKKIITTEDLEPFGITETSADASHKLVFWHVSEFFRLAPSGTLYLQLGVEDGGSGEADFVLAIQRFREFEDNLRVLAFVSFTLDLSIVNIDALQVAIDDAFSDFLFPVRAIATYKDPGTAIPSFSTNSDYRVMVDIGNDFTENGLAKEIFDDVTVEMCGAGGTILGQLIRLSVHQRPSWRSFPVNGNFNSSVAGRGARWQTLADIEGNSTENLTNAVITAFEADALVYVGRTRRSPNAFIAHSRTAGAAGDDFDVVTNGRVIDKGIVLTHDSLIFQLDGPIYVDPTNGQITPDKISELQEVAYNAINDNMVKGKVGDAVELSVDVATGSLSRESVFIDPDQNILSTDILEVQIRLTPVGASKTIIINIGLAVIVA